MNLKKLSDDERGKMEKDLRKQFDADIADTEAYYEDGIERLRQTRSSSRRWSRSR